MSRTAVSSDAQWAHVQPLLPSSSGRAGRPFRDDRRVVEGIIYRYRCGLPWRDVPVKFGPWQTLWKRHRRYSGDGTWDQVLTHLLAVADAAGIVDWAVSVDSTINRAHQPRDEPVPPHRGACRITRISKSSLLIMELAGPGVV